MLDFHWVSMLIFQGNWWLNQGNGEIVALILWLILTNYKDCIVTTVNMFKNFKFWGAFVCLFELAKNSYCPHEKWSTVHQNSAVYLPLTSIILRKKSTTAKNNLIKRSLKYPPETELLYTGWKNLQSHCQKLHWLWPLKLQNKPILLLLGMSDTL